MDYRCYVPKKFRGVSRDIIAHADRIIRDWNRQGYTLTVRQLYYQFVGHDLFPENRKWTRLESTGRWVRDPGGTKNAQPNYDWLGKLVSDARLAGKIPWDSMTDRTRRKTQINTYSSIQQFWDKMVPQYAADHWADQDVYLEVWVEKEALEEVIEKACAPYYAPFLACKGYMSASAMYDASLRYEDALLAGKECHLIHLGDHDPSGIDMTRDIEERLSLLTSQRRSCSCISNNLRETGEYDGDFLCDECSAWYNAYEGRRIRVQRIALDLHQVREYNAPPNPAKVTDSRAKEYIRRFGSESWELDALTPRVMSDLVKVAIEDLIDMDVFERHMQQEELAIERSRELAETI